MIRLGYANLYKALKNLNSGLKLLIPSNVFSIICLKKGVVMNYLVIGVIFILALFAIRFSNKHGIPALLLFIILGMVFGAIGFEFDNFEFADGVATVALSGHYVLWVLVPTGE